MSNKINLYNPILPVNHNLNKAKGAEKKVEGSTSFKDVFQKELKKNVSELKFSAHAQQRIAQSGLKFDQDQLEKISNAVEMASKKGSKESLVLMEKAALVVSVKNNTVITVVDSERMKENVFTNIDSAVIV